METFNIKMMGAWRIFFATFLAVLLAQVTMSLVQYLYLFWWWLR